MVPPPPPVVNQLLREYPCRAFCGFDPPLVVAPNYTEPKHAIRQALLGTAGVDEAPRLPVAQANPNPLTPAQRDCQWHWQCSPCTARAHARASQRIAGAWARGERGVDTVRTHRNLNLNL